MPKRAYAIQWGVLVIALSVLGALIAINLATEYERTQAREEERLTAQTRVIADNLEQKIESASRALESIRNDLPKWQGPFGNQFRDLRLQALPKTLPGIRSMGVLDADGTVIASSVPGYSGHNFRHRDYFTAARANPDADTLYISPPFKSVTGVYLITLSRAIIGPNGEFQGIVAAALDPDYFRTLLQSVLYAPDMWDSIVHGDGYLFIIEPERKGLAGINLSRPGALFDIHKASGKEVTVMSGRVKATNEMRMIAQRTINPASLHMNKPLFIAVSRDLDTVYQTWQRDLIIQSVLYLFILFYSVIGLFIYQGRQKVFDRQAAEVEATLQASEERFRTVFDAAPIGIAMIDAEGRLMRANAALCSLLGFTQEEILSKSLDCIAHPAEEKLDIAWIAACLSGGDGSFQIEKRYLRHATDQLWLHISFSIVSGKAGQPRYYIAQVQNITERKSLIEKLENQANRDYLTNLSNRRHFLNQSEAELRRAKRYGHAFSVLMFDVDYFKKVNDVHGHAAGDIALKTISAAAQNMLRDVDILGRVGGEEFAATLPETDLAGAAGVAERLRSLIERTPIYLHDGSVLELTISVGVSTMGHPDISLEKLMDQADHALYEAKKSGRNRVHF